MNIPFFFLALLFHLLPQDRNAGYVGPPSCSTSTCRDSCILKGYTGGLCLSGICNCLIYKRVVGPVEAMINRNEMQQSPAYFPTNYFDPYQDIRESSMLEFPHPQAPPPPIFGGVETMAAGDSKAAKDTDDMPADLFKHPQLMSGFVETMSADSEIEQGKTKKETAENIGIFIGEKGAGRNIEINAGSNSTQYLPSNGAEKAPELQVSKEKPSNAGQDDLRKIHTDSSGKFVENQMTVKLGNPETDHKVELDLGVKLLPEEKKARRKRDANNAKLEGKPDANNAKLEGKPDATNAKLEGKPDANDAKITPSENLDASVEGVFKSAFTAGKPIFEQGKKPVAQDKQIFKEDKKEETRDNKDQKKEGTKDNKNQKKPKKKPDPDALSERKVSKALGQLDSMLTNMSKDPFAATKMFFNDDKNLFPDSLFGQPAL